MKNKLVRRTLCALLGTAVTLAAVAAPLPAQAHTVTRPEPGVTVRSYDMDEYLDMLLRKGQYEKYERFAKIADAESWSKHLASQTNRKYEYVVSARNGKKLLAAVKGQAGRLGFNAAHDTFTLLGLNKEQAMIKVQHGRQQYIIKLQSVAYGTWKVASVFRIK